MKNNCLRKETLRIEISGSSEKSKEEAVSLAFQNLQNEVRKQESGIIISIRPVSVSVKKLEEKETTERFLFLFMPRKKKKTSVVLQIDAEIDVLDIEEEKQ